MAIGSVLLGGVADKIGPAADDPRVPGGHGARHVRGRARAWCRASCSPWRLLTGIGIGGTLASINAAAAECSNRRWRNLAMALMVIGYPLGGVFGGMFVQKLLASGSWRAVFIVGAWATAAFVPLVWLLVPESVAFLDRRRAPAGARSNQPHPGALRTRAGERAECAGPQRPSDARSQTFSSRDCWRPPC